MPPQLLSRRKAGKYENVGNLQVDSFLQRNYILHTSKFSCKVKETLETDSIVRTAPTSASHLPDTVLFRPIYPPEVSVARLNLFPVTDINQK